MTELDLLTTEVADDLARTVRAALDELCTTDRLNRLYDDPAGAGGAVAIATWSALATEIGLAGLLVPENLGGAGGSARDAAAALTEIGRACAPVPFLTSSVVAVTALLAVGDTTLLPDLAAGRTVVALTAPSTLDGALRNVIGLPADLLLVPVPNGETLALHAIPVNTATVTAVPSLDMTRPVHDISLSGDPGTVIATDAGAAVARALTTGAGLLASEQAGLAQWCLETTVDYLKVRRQFGRVVGGFQALKHRMADLYADIEAATAAAAYAAAALAADDPDVPVAVAVAQSYCGDIAVRAAEEALQLHGGLGMTWEYPIHLRLKRAKADQLILGSSAQHRARLAELVDLTL